MLGVDLYLLWRAGRVELPALAGVYRRAGSQLYAIRADNADWCALRDQFGGVLDDAGRVVEETAEAVCVAVEGYARADDAARVELDRRRGESGRVPG
ncbi:hypothetical protein [Dactylosporangium sp. CA-139066]|uniref:hypothetical protein n=1 Tax=Dactylosporangium sp. CA-139066 TaxID=3239930 RepID=UPI003D8B59B9